MQEKKALNIEIGNRIYLARSKSGYTQEQLAELLDIGVQHLSNVERGVAGISLTALKRTCEVLCVSADYLLLGIGSIHQGSGIINQLQSLPTEQAELAESGIAQLLQALSLANNDE